MVKCFKKIPDKSKLVLNIPVNLRHTTTISQHGEIDQKNTRQV